MSDRRNQGGRNPEQKLWGGRFKEATDGFVEAFTASVTFDRRLYSQDIRGSIAHAEMLAECSIISDDDCASITAGLRAIEEEIEQGEFDWRIDREDVHMNIEARLIERIGDVAKKLHTARSRNDQVATDVRLFLRDELDRITDSASQLQSAIIDLADAHADTIMPGYTHLQAAQPITFGHHLLAWFEMLHRDTERLQQCRARANVLPLGAAALAGTTFPIDRASVARKLGFDGIANNSLDAVSDRDFAIEFCAVASLLVNHTSRWCEELVLWSSQPFDFVQLPDRFCTGSSIMPQKKNPDVAELIRGKTGRVTGHLVSLLTLMKSQPLTYNKDNQEDKEPLFDTVDTVHAILTALNGALPALQVNKAAMYRAADRGFTTATDLADYLVRKGIPFRDAHHVVGGAVARAIEHNCSLAELSLTTLQSFSDTITEDVFDVLTLEGSVAARNHPGGTAPAQVRAAVANARGRVNAQRSQSAGT